MWAAFTHTSTIALTTFWNPCFSIAVLYRSHPSSGSSILQSRFKISLILYPSTTKNEAKLICRLGAFYENIRHIVTGSSRVTVDGFIISGGNASPPDADRFGSAMLNVVCSNVVIRNCVFLWNASENGAVFNHRCSAEILDCLFAKNEASDIGAALGNQYGSTVIAGCAFIDNSGGAMWDGPSVLTVSNSLFSGNVTLGGDGAAILGYRSDQTIVNSIFCGNTVSQAGGRGGALAYYFSFSESGSLIANCLFVGNKADSGAAINNSATTSVKNCTFAGNLAGTSGSGICNGSSLAVSNSIFWSNFVPSGSALYNGASLRVGYCDMEGGAGGIENANGATATTNGVLRNVDPLFVGGPTGTWTANAAYITNLFQSVLTHQGAGWLPNAFAGKIVQPDTNNLCQFLVVSNTVSSLSVWGDLSTSPLIGCHYRVHDYHLKSAAGHWESGLKKWSNDTVTSSCIDAGDPAGGWTNEPAPSGSRLNMGAYGNTAEASKSNIQGPNDINGDGIADSIWQLSTGQASCWFMNSSGTLKSAIAIYTNETSWTIRGVGDMNRDGIADLVWQLPSGQVSCWFMKTNGTLKSSVSILTNATSWTIRTVGDMDGDGTCDLVWQLPSGQVSCWFMKTNGTLKSSAGILTNTTSWTIHAAGDIDGDGVSDLFWQLSTGQVACWVMNPDGTRKASMNIYTGTTSWTVRSAGDMDEDGIADLVWQLPTGEVTCWLMTRNGQMKSAQSIYSNKTAWLFRGLSR